MKFKMIHENYNVADLDKSIAFYEKALGLHEVRRKNGNGFIIVYMGNDEAPFELELTWLEDHPQPYDLGECEFHLAFRTDDYVAAHKLHEEMGCICYENPAMAFISSPPPMVTGWRSFPPESKGASLWAKLPAKKIRPGGSSQR